MNCIALIPDNFFQGIGKPKIPTLIYLAELPIFVLTMWFAIEEWGINGAAFVWMLAATASTATYFIIVNKMYNIKFEYKLFFFLFLIFISGVTIPFIINDIFFKIIFVSLLLLFFSILSWKYLLSNEEKSFIISKFRWNAV